jgi:hypothetical protein
VLFACWLVLCLVVYVPSVSTTIRRLDQMALIPEWRFFAPNPGRHDFHLLYRDKFADGTLTAWTEVAPITRRRATSLLLNPDRRRNKALFDCTQEFAKHVEARDRALELSIPYLTLLNYVSCLPRSPSPNWTQFLLMWSAGDASDKDPEVLFISGLHEL